MSDYFPTTDEDQPPGWVAALSAGMANSSARQWEVLAGISMTLENMTKTMRAQARAARKAERSRMARLPVWYDFAKSGKVPSTGAGAGTLVLNCGGPSQGRMWHVKRLVVGGLTLATAAAGTAEAYATGYISDLSNIPSSLSDIHDATILIGSPLTKMPNIGYYEDGQFTVVAGESLYVVFRTATQGQVYVAAGTVKDIMVAPRDVMDVEG